MKRFVALFLVLVCAAAMLAGCQAADAEQPDVVENVTIQIGDVTPSGATVTITDTNETPYIYGQWYKIQRKTDQGWQDVAPVIKDYGFEDIGYFPNANGQVKFTIDWQWLYGQLPSGTYRLWKETGTQKICAQFTI